MLKFNNYKLTYDKELLSIAELQISNNQHCLIRGANGTGKTSFLKSFFSKTMSSSGLLTWGNLSLAEAIKSKNCRLAYLPQDFKIKDDFYLLDFLKLAITNEEQNKLDYYLSRLPKNLHRNISKLSLGQQRIVALVFALLQAPNLILLDEPSAFIDLEQRTSLAELLADYCAKNCSIVFEVTHQDSLMHLSNYKTRNFHLENQSLLEVLK